MDPIENLRTLHEHEQELRTRSLRLIESRADLRDHWRLVSEAMNLIYAFSHDHKHNSDNELTIQYLGARLFSAAGASIRLALSGYCQKAFDHVRDILETYFLIDYFTIYPEKIAEWKSADKRKRKKDFAPAAIRKALDERSGHTGGEREKIYGTISEYASHPSYPGMRLISASNNLVQVGPFLDERWLVAWLQEMAMRLGHAAMVIVAHSEGNDPALIATQMHYLDVIKPWNEKYLQSSRKSPVDDTEPAAS